MRARIGGLIDCRFRTARHDDAGVAPPLIRGRIHHIRIARVEIEIGRAGVLADRQNGFHVAPPSVVL